MKKTLTYLLGAATASAWWAAEIWAYKSENTNNTDVLWVAAIILTLATLGFMIFIVLEEK